MKNKPAKLLTNVRFIIGSLLPIWAAMILLLFCTPNFLSAHADHGIWEDLGDEPIVLRETQGPYTAVLYHRPYLNTRKQLMALVVEDGFSQRIEEYDVQAFLSPVNDQKSSESLFIKWDDHETGLVKLTPMIRDDREYQIIFQFSDFIRRFEFVFSGIKAEPAEARIDQEEISNPGPESDRTIAPYFLASLFLICIFVFLGASIFMRKSKG